jgi:predicted phosphodiesterase
MLKKVLVVGDPHSSPDTDNRRFDWLGQMILEENPDLVICIGDFADLNSLSSYDRGKKTAELRRYRHDIRAVHDGLNRINKPLEDYNQQKKNIRKAQRIVPRKVMVLGNHEVRIEKAVNLAPELEGTLNITDLGYEQYGWQVVPFKRPIEIEGTYFAHYFPSGVKGEPISGFNIGANVIAKNLVSSVCGHSHLFDLAIRNRPDGNKVIGLCTGWYGEQPTFSDATENLWWSGLILLHDMQNGSFDIEQLGIERIRSKYG